MVVFGQKWTYSGKVLQSVKKGCNRANLLQLGKVVVLEQSGCIRINVVLFGKKWLYSGKIFVIGQEWLYSGKVVEIGQKWLYSGKVVVFGKNWLFSGKSGFILESGCIRAKLL